MSTSGSRAQRAEISASALGMVFFISSEVMFFAALFGVYFTIRSSAAAWPPIGTPQLETLGPAIATALLVASSVTMHRAAKAGEKDNRAGTSTWLLVTIALGTIFLAAQAYEYTQLGFELTDDVYGTLFYSMTGFHGLHVFGGLMALGIVLVKNKRGQISGSSDGPLVSASYYWHFVDVVWVLLFATLYLLD